MTMPSAGRSRPGAPTKNAQDPAAKNALPVGPGTLTEEGTIVNSGSTCGPLEGDLGTSSPKEGK